MDFIIDAIVEWLKGLLVDGIMGNLDGLFDNVNQSVGEIATQVGTTPADWNAGVFSMIRQISETAILPIAGVILTFVMTYELIQMLIERNNLHEVDTWMFFNGIFKGRGRRRIPGAIAPDRLNGKGLPPHHPDACGLRTRIPGRTVLRAMMARSPKAASFKRTDGKAVPLTA